jgi:oligopeptide/dipeptide ABC transporter ATP-binding protein
VRKLQAETNAAVLLIAHNLGVIRTLCDRVGVMYAGKIVEEGPIDDMFADPKHPYTRGLLASTPRLDAVAHRLTGIPGTPPAMDAPPLGCAFAARCTHQVDQCLTDAPQLRTDDETGRKLACWHSE